MSQGSKPDGGGGRGRRILRLTGRVLVIIAALALVAGGGLWLAARESLGVVASGSRRARVEASPQWKDGAFRNTRTRVDGSMSRAYREFFLGGSPHRVPSAALPVLRPDVAILAAAPAPGVRVTWLGHSTLLLEIDGRRLLIDPVWGERVSPFSFAGPRRFHPPPLPLDQLPPVDAVVLSHDHYDHLDTPTIKALARRDVRFIAPLGVGAHLEAWGVPAARIAELDWWEEVEVAGLRLTATPARHFSGRGFGDAAQTLWAGWAIAGPAHRVFYSGDTALDDAHATIGERLGPFDLTMIEVGAYDALWADVHLGPEQAVRVHQLVKGGVMVPVHWGTFNLALHGWTEPIERVVLAAAGAGVRVATPRPGEVVDIDRVPTSHWWPTVPWRSVRDAPAFSTGVSHLMGNSAGETPGNGAVQP